MPTSRLSFLTGTPTLGIDAQRQRGRGRGRAEPPLMGRSEVAVDGPARIAARQTGGILSIQQWSDRLRAESRRLALARSGFP